MYNKTMVKEEHMYDMTLGGDERTEEQQQDVENAERVFEIAMERVQEMFDSGVKTGFSQGRGSKIEFKNGRIMTIELVINFDEESKKKVKIDEN